MVPDWFAKACAGSETGELALKHDWSATPLGDPTTWPGVLRHAVAMCFATRFPVLVTWGPDLTMIYNDGYRDILGPAKHPAFGKAVRDVWPEIWHVIEPLFDHVLTTGQPTWVADQRLIINRAGFEEEAYFTYSYSALRDDDAVRGVLDISTETTEHVIGRRRLSCIGDLSARLQSAGDDVGEVARITTDVLRLHQDDVPAAVLYLNTDDDRPALLASTRERRRPRVASDELLQHVARTGELLELERAIVAPIGTPSAEGTGALVLEASPLRPFDDAYRLFLRLVGFSVNAALSTAFVHMREVGELRRVSEALQLAMRPEVIVTEGVAARYLPAAGGLAVGGDWYDVLALGDDRVALLVGDCVGQGLRAATVMAQLRSASRALLLEHGSALATIEGLDRFAHSIEGAELTTVVCAIVDRRRHTITYSSAGHPPPLLVGSSGVRWLDAARHWPLAIDGDVSRSEATVPLEPGDTLVLYTDGLVERRGELLDIGLERLARAATEGDPSDLAAFTDHLVDELLPDGGNDDVAIVVHRADH